MNLFDLHCDTLTECCKKDQDLYHSGCQVSLEQKTKINRWCQVFAIFIPDTVRGEDAKEFFRKHYEYYILQCKKYSGILQPLENYTGLIKVNNQKIYALLAVEGGCVLAGDISMVDTLAECGVKVLTLTWNGQNEIGSGHQTADGLTAFGIQAVKRLEERGIIIDVSHLNDTGFNDVVKNTVGPFIASHSNARSVCGNLRNLTDPQIDEIIRREGLIGINFHQPFLSESGLGGISDILRHIHYILERGGQNVLAIGSDFDGADLSEEINSPQKIAVLQQAMVKSGLSEFIVQKILYGNALSFFKRMAVPKEVQAD